MAELAPALGTPRHAAFALLELLGDEGWAIAVERAAPGIRVSASGFGFVVQVEGPSVRDVAVFVLDMCRQIRREAPACRA